MTYYSEIFIHHRAPGSLDWSGAKAEYEMAFQAWLAARRGGDISDVFCTWNDTALQAAQERDDLAARNRGFVNGAQRHVEFTRWRP